MINIEDKSLCCGCTACANICPTKAITMIPDKLGFLYPSVNQNKCVDCGLCEKVCSFKKDYDKSLNFKIPKTYAVRHNDIKEVETSRSGAMFVALSDWIISKGGVVYGAGYIDHFKVVHKRASCKAECNEFKGSKYVQSDLRDSFSSVLRDLKSGKLVLFSGTPCQTSGLRSFLDLRNAKTEKLYLVDIVCHGVPSPYIWRDYLNSIEKEEGQRAQTVSFRDKSIHGWAAHVESVTFADKKIFLESYKYLFYKNIMLRTSCGVCPFANINRPSDLTLADFWGWEKVDPTINADDKGLSLVLINTLKGDMIFNTIGSVIKKIEVKVDDCLQTNLMNPSIIDAQRNQFEDDYYNKGFDYINKRYGNKGYRYKIYLIKRKTRSLFRIIMKKIKR